MENLLPVATQSASQTVFITTTGVEKGLTVFGGLVLLFLALTGLLTIVRAVIKNNIGIKKIH